MKDGEAGWSRWLDWLYFMSRRTEVILAEDTIAPGIVRVQQFSIDASVNLFVMLHEHQLALVSFELGAKIAFVMFLPSLEKRNLLVISAVLFKNMTPEATDVLEFKMETGLAEDISFLNGSGVFEDDVIFTLSFIVQIHGNDGVLCEHNFLGYRQWGFMKIWHLADIFVRDLRIVGEIIKDWLTACPFVPVGSQILVDAVDDCHGTWILQNVTCVL